MWAEWKTRAACTRADMMLAAKQIASVCCGEQTNVASVFGDTTRINAPSRSDECWVVPGGWIRRTAEDWRSPDDEAHNNKRALSSDRGIVRVCVVFCSSRPAIAKELLIDRIFYSRQKTYISPNSAFLYISLLTAKHPSTSQRSSLEQHQLLVEPPIVLLKIMIWSFNGQKLNSANELFPSPDLASGISYQQNWKLQKILLRLNANLKHISFPLPLLNNITLFILL